MVRNKQLLTQFVFEIYVLIHAALKEFGFQYVYVFIGKIINVDGNIQRKPTKGKFMLK